MFHTPVSFRAPCCPRSGRSRSHRLLLTAATAVLAGTVAGGVTTAAAAPPDPVFALAVVVGSPSTSGVRAALTTSLDQLRSDATIDEFIVVDQPSVDGLADTLGQYADQGFGAIVVQGLQYAEALTAAANAHPATAFVYVPGAPVDDRPPSGLPNVTTILAAADQGGTVFGHLVVPAQTVSWGGPAEPTGDDAVLLDAFAAAADRDRSTILPVAAGSTAPVDVLLQSGEHPSSAPATTTLAFGSSLPEGAPAGTFSIVNHYGSVLADIVSGFSRGVIGGHTLAMTLFNDGMSIDAASDADANALEDAMLAAFPPAPETTVPRPAPVADDTGGDTGGDPAPTPEPAAPADPAAPAPAPAPAPEPAATPPPAPSGRTIGGCEGMGVGGANNLRAAVGVAALGGSGLGSCDWARHLAETNTFAHAGTHAEVLFKSSGGGCGSAWSAWQNSAAHYNIIISTNYSVGDFVCVTDSDGASWAVGRLA